jgi:hypothetical protein
MGCTIQKWRASSAVCRGVVQMLKNKISARQLGYYLFWNLRSATSGLALTREDVYSTAQRAGLRHQDSAWTLLDRNGDTFATMDEVLDSVEAVYANRKALARTLVDSQTVVGQVRLIDV